MKKKEITLVVLGLCCCGCLTTASMLQERAIASDWTIDVFQTKGIELTTDYALPEYVGCGDSRKGLLLTGETNGSYVQLEQALTGDFSLDFRVFSTLVYNKSHFIHSI